MTIFENAFEKGILFMFFRPVHSNWLHYLFIFSGFLAQNTAVAAEELTKLEKLTSPSLTEQVMKSSGFQIPDKDDLGMIFVALGEGKYQIVGRFNVPEESITGKTKKGEVVESDNTCITYAPNQEEFQPTKTCSYKVNLSDEQISNLAHGKARVNEFFETINQDGAIPAIGGREITDPIQVSTFNLDLKVNRAMHIANAKVWLACWNADASSNVNLGFDLPKTDGLDEQAKCRKAKLTASALNGKIEVAVTSALAEATAEERQTIAEERQAATAENNKATAENDKATDENNKATDENNKATDENNKATDENNKAKRLNQILEKWNKS